MFYLHCTQLIESQYKAIHMSWKTGLSAELQKCFVKGHKFFCVQTRFISEAIYSLYPTCFLVLTSYIIQSNNIRTVSFWFPAALLLASHRGPNREHLTEMWHLLTPSSCLTENKFCPYFKEHLIDIFVDVISVYALSHVISLHSVSEVHEFLMFKKSRYSACSNERSKAFWR